MNISVIFQVFVKLNINMIAVKKRKDEMVELLELIRDRYYIISDRFSAKLTNEDKTNT
jgi:hypothetical protein